MKEYHKKWYEDNKDVLKSKMKENHKHNLERDRNRSNKWYKDNREEILKKSAEKYKRTETKLEMRNRHLRENYGISIQEYDAMFLSQQGRCFICGSHQSELKMALGVDHEHKTGKVRKLLCHKCNLAIGLLGDDVNLFKKVVLYLEGE